jgi:hypothetical protein
VKRRSSRICWDDGAGLDLFRRGVEICRASGIDLAKRQFKAESETHLSLARARESVAAGGLDGSHLGCKAGVSW